MGSGARNSEKNGGMEMKNAAARKISLFLLSAAMFVFAGYAAAESPANADFEYVVRGGGITITGYRGGASEVVIPAQIEGLPVRAIGDGAFNDNDSLTSVTIPGSVITIGEMAFANCGSLTNVTIGEGVRTIADAAFTYSGLLADITIPDSVTEIAGDAFYFCDSLPEITRQRIRQINPDAYFTRGETL